MASCKTCSAYELVSACVVHYWPCAVLVPPHTCVVVVLCGHSPPSRNLKPESKKIIVCNVTPEAESAIFMLVNCCLQGRCERAQGLEQEQLQRRGGSIQPAGAFGLGSGQAVVCVLLSTMRQCFGFGGARLEKIIVDFFRSYYYRSYYILLLVPFVCAL
jgi:hypothetical protein